jgi:hypothetical protein
MPPDLPLRDECGYLFRKNKRCRADAWFRSDVPADFAEVISR